LKRASYWLAENLYRAGLFLLASTEYSGRENVPATGPLVVVSNHLSMSDIPLLAMAIRRKLTFLGKIELWKNPFIGPLATWYGALPIDKNSNDIGAVRRSLQVLKAGGALVVFPQGTRSPEAKLLPGHPGASLIALHSGAAVLPVAITGTEGKGKQKRFRPRLTVTVGRPYVLSKEPGVQLKDQLAPATERLMRSIAELLPPERRGAYQ